MSEATGVAGIVERAKTAAVNALEKFSGGSVAEGSAQTNPANAVAKGMEGRGRIPLSTPRMKLEVPEIPGYVCQWFLDTPGRIMQARQAGYEFVSPDEIALNPGSLAGSHMEDGNTSLSGSQITYHGSVGDDGKAQKLYLLKQKREFYDLDQAETAKRNEGVAASLRGGYDVGGNRHEEGNDSRSRTVGQHGGGQRVKMPDLFIPRDQRKTFKAK